MCRAMCCYPPANTCRSEEILEFKIQAALLTLTGKSALLATKNRAKALGDLVRSADREQRMRSYDDVVTKLSTYAGLVMLK